MPLRPNPTVAELLNVTKAYGVPGAAGFLTVLDRISLAIAPGESLALVGPSGSGKSTLLHLLGGLDRPTAGEVHLAGHAVAELDETALARLRNRHLGFVFQSHFLLPQCSVLENVLVPTLVNTDRDTDEPAGERARRLLARVRLDDRLAHRPGQLSGGECQRVALVRALINRPQLLLADEPTGALDSVTAHSLVDLLVELNREEKVALVVATHAPTLAARLARVLALSGGRLSPRAV